MPSSERLPLILGSGSPRRRELLERFWDPEAILVMVPQFNENNVIAQPGGAAALVKEISAGKMQALHSQFQLPDQYIALTADTIVVLDNKILGKPTDPADAAQMLRQLSGKTHQVMTSVCLDAVCADELYTQNELVVTDVSFGRLLVNQIAWYTATGEPFDKAGAYGIQGYGAALVEKIDGCYYNVMGLPVNRLMVMLRKAASHFSSNSSFSDLLPWN